MKHEPSEGDGAQDRIDEQQVHPNVVSLAAEMLFPRAVDQPRRCGQSQRPRWLARERAAARKQRPNAKATMNALSGRSTKKSISYSTRPSAGTSPFCRLRSRDPRPSNTQISGERSSLAP